MHAQKLLAAIMMAASPAFAEAGLKIEEIPALVRDTYDRIAPGLSIETVVTKDIAGRRVYAFEGRGNDGARIVVDVLADGSFEKVEMETKSETLPVAVRESIEKKYPVFDIVYAETLVGSDGAFTYRVLGQAADGTGLAIKLAESGKLISAENAIVADAGDTALAPSLTSFTQAQE